MENILTKDIIKKLNELISKASKDLQNIVRYTSTRELVWLNRLAHKNVVVKCENQQITGDFKFRGAYNRLLKQPKDRPIVVASAGNHALGVAEAAARLNVKTTICLPTIVNRVKHERLAKYGHSMILEGSSLEEATVYAKKLCQQNDWDFVSPYNNQDIIAGQATVAIEFLEQHPGLTHIVVPVGGGGLISGIALAAKAINPDIKIIGVQAERYPSLYTSIKNDCITRVPDQPTMADGLAVNLEQNSMTFYIVKEQVDQLVTVTEEALAAAVIAMLYRESLLIEPAGAAALAAVITESIGDCEGQIGVILSGGNITVKNLSRIINYPFKDESLYKYFDYRGDDVSKRQVTWVRPRYNVEKT